MTRYVYDGYCNAYLYGYLGNHIYRNIIERLKQIIQNLIACT